MRIVLALIVGCGASTASPQPVELAPPTTAAVEVRPALQVGIEALRVEGTHGELRVDHVQLGASSVVAQLFRPAEPDAERLAELRSRIGRSRLAWRFVEGAAVWLPCAFEVTDAEEIEPLIARILPDARPLESLDGFANDELAIVRVGERTFLTGDLHTIRNTLDVGAPLEVTWPTGGPAVEGWVGFDSPETTPVVMQGPGGSSVLHRAELVATLDGDALRLEIGMSSPNPEALAALTRSTLDHLGQMSTQSFMRLLMREPLFDDAQVHVEEGTVRLVSPMTPSQAELMLSFVVSTLGRSTGARDPRRSLSDSP